MKESYIAALEIGSSKITGAVGHITPDNTLKVLAIEQEQSKDSVRYGIIHNPEEVASKVSRIVDRLNASSLVSPRKVKGVYVGLSGRSMRSIESPVKLIFQEETEITGEILDRLREDAAAKALDSNLEVLSIVPRSYDIDGMETSSPKGAMGKSISVIYDIIVGRTELKRNILRALSERTGLIIRGMMVTPLATSEIVLTEDEKLLGCMLVDFGAETTSVSIYRKGALCYFATIPLGGRNITRDLTSLSILEEKAEEIKKENGKAVAPETPSNINLYGVKLSDVSNLVVARSEEIVANVIQQIEYAGLKEKDLPGGIICVGGGAKLAGLLDLISQQSGLNARLGHLPAFIQTMESRAKRDEIIQPAALLYAGALMEEEDCLEMPVEDNFNNYDEEEYEEEMPEEREPRKPGIFNKIFRGIGKGISNMYSSPSDEDSELD